MLLIQQIELLKNDESEFSLHTGMIALEVQQKLIVEINTLLMI